MSIKDLINSYSWPSKKPGYELTNFFTNIEKTDNYIAKVKEINEDIVINFIYLMDYINYISFEEDKTIIKNSFTKLIITPTMISIYIREGTIPLYLRQY